MNILVIFSDQQHKYALGRVDRQFKTPNLDALCDDGVLFEYGYSNNPVCGPYRGCLMTGQYTSHCCVTNNGMPLPEGRVTMASALREHGYATGFTGKWHLGGNGSGPIPENIRGGFEHFIGYQCYNGFEPKPPFNNAVVFFDEQDQPHQYDYHRTDVTTDLAIEQLHQLTAEGKPFFQLVGYQAPHYPEQPSPQYAALYENYVFRNTPDFVNVEPYTPTFSPPSPRPFENCPDYQRYGGNMEEYQRLYAGMVSQVDAGVGRIISELKNMGLYEDTLIIYTSDHGDMQGSHGLKNKCLPYEKSCGVPFIARIPGGLKGVTSKAPVSGVDIFTTALSAAGIHDVDGDGVDITPIMTGNGEPVREYVIAEYTITSQSGYSWRMIMDGRYKLTIAYETSEPLYLFDLQDDPYELRNLKDEPDQQTRIGDLKRILLGEVQ